MSSTVFGKARKCTRGRIKEHGNDVRETVAYLDRKVALEAKKHHAVASNLQPKPRYDGGDAR